MRGYEIGKDRRDLPFPYDGRVRKTRSRLRGAQVLPASGFELLERQTAGLIDVNQSSGSVCEPHLFD